MTIIVGFVPPRGDSIVLWADSAITHSLRPRNTQSSFGEAVDQTGSETSEEGVVKLLQLSPASAATWAGDAHQGHAFLRWMQPHMQGSQPLLELLQKGANTFEGTAGFTCLIARYLNRPELCAVTFPERVVDEIGIAAAGSLNDEMKRSINASIEEGVFAGWSNDQVLVGLQALFLVRSCRSMPFEECVGGATFGLTVTAGGVTWGPDTAWIVLPRDASMMPTHGVVYIRHGVGIVWSTLLGRFGRSFPMFRTVEERQLFEEQIDDIVPEMNALSARFTIVSMILGASAVVIDADRASEVLSIEGQTIRVDEDIVTWLRSSGPHDNYAIVGYPATRHRGALLIDQKVETTVDARLLAEYLVLGRTRGLDPARRQIARNALLSAFPDDEWLHFVLA